MLKQTTLIAALALCGSNMALAQTDAAAPAGKAAAKAAGKAAKNGKANQLSPGERRAGWRLLFDGKTTKGWRGYKKPEAPESWKIVDGALVLDGKGGDLVTDEQFGDFELALDWRVAEKGNSGIIYRAAETDGPVWSTGPEYQLLDDAGHPDATAGKEGNHRAGSLYDVYPPAKAVVRPAGEWNTTRIVANGKKIEHYLNGEKVVDAEIGSEDWNKRVAASKWSKMAQWGTVEKGHIALQDHGDKIEFRNIRIRDLAAGAKGAAKKQK